MARRIESHLLAGPAGKLEALLEEPEEQEPTRIVVVCHPHPQHGGTMHNKVVYRLARGLRKAGYVALRFNYRGVNLSEGSYDRGQGETEDARAALDWLRNRYPNLPYSLAGFSFGSRVILRLGCPVPDVEQLIAVGFPTSRKEYGPVSDCPGSKIFIQSDHDEHAPKAEFQSVFDTLQEPKKVIWIAAEDHFFKGALDQFERKVVEMVRR